jgi:hypothetical protein
VEIVRSSTAKFVRCAPDAANWPARDFYRFQDKQISASHHHWGGSRCDEHPAVWQLSEIVVGRQGDPVLLRSSVFVLALEIKLDLDVVWITQKNLPTGAVWNLVHVV